MHVAAEVRHLLYCRCLEATLALLDVVHHLHDATMKNMGHTGEPHEVGGLSYCLCNIGTTVTDHHHGEVGGLGIEIPSFKLFIQKLTDEYMGN